MKNILFLIVLISGILVGCKKSTIYPDCDNPPQTTNNAITPGDFTGTWEQDSLTFPCLITIIEGDSVLMGSITNSTTGEVLTLQAPEKRVYYPSCGATWRGFEGIDSVHSNAANKTVFADSGKTIYYNLNTTHLIFVSGTRP